MTLKKSTGRWGLTSRWLISVSLLGGMLWLIPGLARVGWSAVGAPSFSAWSGESDRLSNGGLFWSPPLLAQVPEFVPFTRTGRLTTDDELLPDGTYGQIQTFEGLAGQTVTIDLLSDDFDAYLLLLDPRDQLVVQDDDGGEGTNARLSLPLTVSGLYQIVVNTALAGEIGQYTLQVAPAIANETDLADANQLNNRVLQLYEQGQFAEALPLAQQVLAIRRQILGDQHPEVAIAINNVAEMHRAMGNYAAAEPLLLEARAIQEANPADNQGGLAITLNNLSLIYQQQGRYQDAEPLTQQAIDIYEALGPSIYLGRGYNNLAELYRQQGRFTEAADYYGRAIDLFEQLSGPDSPDVALSSLNLGLVEQARGEYTQAETLYQRAITTFQTAFEGNHPNLALAFLNLGALYQTQSRYSEAESLYQQALEIQQRHYGDQHPEVVYTLGSFGQLYQAQGRYDNAEAMLQSALTIASSSVGRESPLVATLLNRLGELYRLAGRYSEAEETGLKALTLQANLFGTQHPDYAGTLNNLALVYTTQGRYPDATPLFEQAVTILENTLGDQHPSVALSLNNWAELYRNQGNYEAAAPLYQRALAIQTTVLSDAHPDLAITLNNLALLSYQSGNLEDATELQEQAVTIFEQALGTDHPLLGLALNNLAETYRIRGFNEAAKPRFERALAIQRKTLSDNHPDIGLTLNNLGLVKLAEKDFDQAETHFLEALRIFKTSLGDKHPNLSLVLNNLALLYQLQGNPSAALKQLQQSQAIEDYNLTLILSTGSETTKAAYIESLPELSHNISFNLQFANDNEAAAQLALLTILQRKGRVLDAVTDNLKSLRQRLNPADQQLLEDWANLRSQLATLIVGGLGNQSPDLYQNKVTNLEQQIQALEKTLGDRSSEFRSEAQPIALESIQSLIPDNAALIEFVVYHPLVPEDFNGQLYGPPRYGVYLLKPSGEILWHDLGDAATLDEQVGEFRRLLQSRSPRFQALARNLYTALIEPLQPALSDIDHLLISPTVSSI
jgi:tetratricopeptide (TPR) repeat protein